MAAAPAGLQQKITNRMRFHACAGRIPAEQRHYFRGADRFELFMPEPLFATWQPEPEASLELRALACALRGAITVKRRGTTSTANGGSVCAGQSKRIHPQTKSTPR
jgi:hypothetical protein